MELEGRVALVTGAARGIGRAIAMTLADAGAAVGIADAHLARFQGERYGRLRNRWSGDDETVPTAEAITATGRDSHAVAMDVADWDSVERGVAELEAALGPIDVLVNNAGITTNFVSLARTS